MERWAGTPISVLYSVPFPERDFTEKPSLTSLPHTKRFNACTVDLERVSWAINSGTFLVGSGAGNCLSGLGWINISHFIVHSFFAQLAVSGNSELPFQLPLPNDASHDDDAAGSLLHWWSEFLQKIKKKKKSYMVRLIYTATFNWLGEEGLDYLSLESWYFDCKLYGKKGPPKCHLYYCIDRYVVRLRSTSHGRIRAFQNKQTTDNRLQDKHVCG